MPMMLVAPRRACHAFEGGGHLSVYSIRQAQEGKVVKLMRMFVLTTLVPVILKSSSIIRQRPAPWATVAFTGLLSALDRKFGDVFWNQAAKAVVC